MQLQDLFIGSTVTIYARQIKITGYSDDFTKKHFAAKREKTLALVKPHAVDNLGRIMDIILANELTISKIQLIQLQRRDAEEFYGEHQGRPFFPALTGMMSQAPIVAMELIGMDAVAKWRALLGPTNADEARSTAPNSIRAQFGVDTTQNACHGSDSAESADRELGFFFGRNKPWPTTAHFQDCTLAIIKPHAVNSGLAGRIIDDILQEGFDITALEKFDMDRTTAEEFYEVYKGVVPEYSGMVDELTSGPCIAIEVRGENVVANFRDVAGPADPEVGRYLRPKALRSRYGVDKIKNAIHATDLPEDGKVEVDYFFQVLHNVRD